MAWWRIGWLRPWDRNSLRFERSIVHLKSSWLLIFAGPINWKLTLLQSNDKFVEQLRALAWCLLWLTCTLNITERWRYRKRFLFILFAGMIGFHWKVALLQSDDQFLTHWHVEYYGEVRNTFSLKIFWEHEYVVWTCFLDQLIENLYCYKVMISLKRTEPAKRSTSPILFPSLPEGRTSQSWSEMVYPFT